MKTLIFSLAVSLATFANADILYWMVSDGEAATAQQDDSSDFAYFKAVSSTDGSVQTLDTKTGGDVYTAYLTDPVAAFQYNGIESYSSGYSFYIELASSHYKTETVAYNDLANFIIKSGNGLPSSNFNPSGFGSGSTAYNVPEPTSGLLFVIGGMLLGLKRKRQV